MTKKEMITACIDNQIEKGVIKAETRTMQIKARLNGKGCCKAMTKAECLSWYNSVFHK